MKPTYLATPSDLASLQMENELLAHEVRHLRARLKAHERGVGDRQEALKRAQARLEEATQRMGGARAKLAASRKRARVSAERLERQADDLRRAQEAANDLQWLLRRLDESVLGVPLRRVEGFKVLRDRHLRQDIPSIAGRGAE